MPYFGDHPSDALGRAARRLYSAGAISLGGGVGVERQGQRENPSYVVVDGAKAGRKFSGPLQAMTIAFGLAGAKRQEGTPGGTTGVNDPVRAARVWELEGVIADARETLARFAQGAVIPSLRSDFAERRRQEATRELDAAQRERARLLRADSGKVSEATSSRNLPPIPNKPGKTNWVEKAGGLPKFIERIARHIQASGHPSPVAAAASQVRIACTTGRTANGRIKLSPAAKARYCKAWAEWKRKAASSKAKEAETRNGVAALTLAAVAEEAAERLDALEAEMGDGFVDRLLAGEHQRDGRMSRTREALADEMDRLAEACVDDLALVEMADLPRHRDGKWSNTLRQRKRRVRKGHPVFSAAA